MLSIKEWNLDTMMYKYLWTPFKWIGRQLQFLSSNKAAILVTIIAAVSVVGAVFKPEFLLTQRAMITVILLFISLAIILFVFSYRGSALNAWAYLLVAHVFIMAGIGINADHVNTIEIIFYGSGIAPCFWPWFLLFAKYKGIDNDITLNHYHGYVYEQKGTALLFLLAAIGMLGFPITAAFIGIDVLFTYVNSDQVIPIILLTLCFIFIELAAIRIFLRIYLGLHKKLNHPIAFSST